MHYRLPWASCMGKFLTNDPDLKRVSEIKILVLDDYLLK